MWSERHTGQKGGRGGRETNSLLPSERLCAPSRGSATCTGLSQLPADPGHLTEQCHFPGAGDTLREKRKWKHTMRRQTRRQKRGRTKMKNSCNRWKTVTNRKSRCKYSNTDLNTDEPNTPSKRQRGRVATCCLRGAHLQCHHGAGSEDVAAGSPHLHRHPLHTKQTSELAKLSGVKRGTA